MTATTPVHLQRIIGIGNVIIIHYYNVLNYQEIAYVLRTAISAHRA